MWECRLKLIRNQEEKKTTRVDLRPDTMLVNEFPITYNIAFHQYIVQTMEIAMIEGKI